MAPHPRAPKPRIRKPPLQFDLSGFPVVHGVIKELGERFGNTIERKLARAALGAGVTEMAKIIRERSPKRTRIRKSIAGKQKNNKYIGRYEAKAGLNVGSKRGTAPHAHFFTLGTANRYHKKTGKFVGRVQPNDFVRRAADEGGPRVIVAMTRRITKRLPIEIENLRRRKAAAYAKKSGPILPGPEDSNVLFG